VPLPEKQYMTEKDRDTFVGGSSTNSSRYNQNERARQSGDNDLDRVAPVDDKAAEQTSQAYFENGTAKEDSAEQSKSKDELREQQEGSLKNSK
jgi:hypothetical protein